MPHDTSWSFGVTPSKCFQHRSATKLLCEPTQTEYKNAPLYLAPVTTSQKDKNSSWSNRGSQLPLVLAKGFFAMTQKFARDVFSWVVSGLEEKEQKCFTDQYSMR